MSAIARALFVLFVTAVALDTARAGDSDVSLGGFICVRPFAPACANQRDTYQKTEDISACRRELDRFSAATAAYRDCLERQIGAAVRQANDALDRFRCLSQRRSSCESPVKSP